MKEKKDLFRLCPQYVLFPQLQSTCHYIENHHVKIWHVRLGDENNMHPLSWGGGGAQTEKIPKKYARGACIFYQRVINVESNNLSNRGYNLKKMTREMIKMHESLVFPIICPQAW